MKNGFFDLHDFFGESLEDSRDEQTHNERVLQSQFVSRIGFVTQQMLDLQIVTRNAIVQHGITIGNPTAPCILEAERMFQEATEVSSGDLMTVSDIAKKDFMRIPDYFVHPHIENTERTTQGFLNEVITRLASGNIVTGADEILQDLESSLEGSTNSFPSVRAGFYAEVDEMRRQMNYAKAEIFPLLEYVLSYYREGADAVIASLLTCN